MLRCASALAGVVLAGEGRRFDLRRGSNLGWHGQCAGFASAASKIGITGRHLGPRRPNNPASDPLHQPKTHPDGYASSRDFEAAVGRLLTIIVSNWPLSRIGVGLTKPPGPCFQRPAGATGPDAQWRLRSGVSIAGGIYHRRAGQRDRGGGIPRGKSGHRRARWWVTPTRGNPRESATETKQPMASPRVMHRQW